MTLTKYTSRCFIAVPVLQQAAANAAAESVVKGGIGTFTVQWPPQDETGTVVPKYYLCDWQMLPAQRTALEAAFLAAGVQATFYDRDDWDPALCTQVTYATVDADLKTKTAALQPAFARTATPPTEAAQAPPWWRRVLHWLQTHLLGWLCRDWR